jgi:ribosomal protein L37AE/L43A
MAFFCPSCQRTLRLNRHGIAQHRAECGAAFDETTAAMPPRWRCEKCDFTLPAAAWKGGSAGSGSVWCMENR